jgi:hypothetical protein
MINGSISDSTGERLNKRGSIYRAIESKLVLKLHENFTADYSNCPVRQYSLIGSTVDSYIRNNSKRRRSI